jgi:hypothetical protein
MALEKPFAKEKCADEQGNQATIINNHRENSMYEFLIAGEGYFVATPVPPLVVRAIFCTRKVVERANLLL